MRTHKLHWISALSLVLGFAVTGCAKDDGGSDTNAETGGESTDASASATMSGTDTSATMTSTTMTTSMTSAESSDTGPSTVSVTDTSTGEPMPLPNGESCDSNEGCESMMCFLVGPLGGICGECLTDADCAATTGGGCSIPNPLAMPPEGAVCNMGEPGEGCMSDAVCADGQLCAEILNVPGIIQASTCGECLTDADCMGGDLCSPAFDIAELSGIKTCVPPGSVADGEGCDFAGSGDMACMSGFCIESDVGGLMLVSLGVCNPCEVDGDCGPMETCELPMIGLDGITPGACVPM